MQEIEFKEKLVELVPKFYEINEIAKSSKKESESYKEEIKTIFDELNITSFEHANIKVNVQEIEKNSFIEPLVINYLRQNNLEHLIKTKEYIDEADILMAASKGELNILDLEPFTSTKIEKRITVKRGK